MEQKARASGSLFWAQRAGWGWRQSLRPRRKRLPASYLSQSGLNPRRSLQAPAHFPSSATLEFVPFLLITVESKKVHASAENIQPRLPEPARSLILQAKSSRLPPHLLEDHPRSKGNSHDSTAWILVVAATGNCSAVPPSWSCSSSPRESVFPLINWASGGPLRGGESLPKSVRSSPAFMQAPRLGITVGSTAWKAMVPHSSEVAWRSSGSSSWAWLFAGRSCWTVTAGVNSMLRREDCFWQRPGQPGRSVRPRLCP